MKNLMRVASFAGLALVLAPAVAYLAGSLAKGPMTTLMMAGTIVWFGTVPFWMRPPGAQGPE